MGTFGDETGNDEPGGHLHSPDSEGVFRIMRDFWFIFLRKTKIVLTISFREMQSHFASSIAYVTILVFLFLTGIFFYNSMVDFSNYCSRLSAQPMMMSQISVNDMVRGFLGTMGIVLLFMVPGIAMRVIAEEKKTGTAELLLTAPITSFEVVVGKFLGSLSVLLSMIIIALIYPAILLMVGNPDLPPILVGYLGIVLLGAAFLAMGLFFSSITENQTVAFLLSFGASLLIWIFSWVAANVNPVIGRVLGHLSFLEHLQDFLKGVIDTTHVLFFLSVIFISLFLTQRVIESRRWS